MFPLRDTIPSRYFPVATTGLIVLNVLVFFFELSLPPDQLEEFFRTFGMVPYRYASWHGFPVPTTSPEEYFPFLTMMFLHGGWLHLIGNMWFLYLFGDNVEDRMGSGRFLLFYLLC